MGKPPKRTGAPAPRAGDQASAPTNAPSSLKLSTRDDLVMLEVHVVVRAAKTAVIGQHDGRVKVALDAPPVDGAANEALLRFFAKALSLRQRDVTLVHGDKSRQKTLAIRGSSEAAVRQLCQGDP